MGEPLRLSLIHIYHIIAVDKTCREIVQGDKTGDKPLSEMLKAVSYTHLDVYKRQA